MSEPKKKILTIDFDSDWVTIHREDKLPSDVISESLKATAETLKCDLALKDSSYYFITIVFSDDESNQNGRKIQDAIKDLLAKQYPDDDISGVVTFSEEDVREENAQEAITKEVTTEEVKTEEAKTEQAKTEEPKEDEKDDKEEAKKESADSEVKLSIKEKIAKVSAAEAAASGVAKRENAVNGINALVGAKEFKALAEEIQSVAGEIARTKTYDVFCNQCYLFAIGDGYGLSTYLQLFAKLILDNKLCEESTTCSVREVKLGEYKEDKSPFSEAYAALDNGSPKSFKVLCVDISEWMDKTDNRFFKQFLRAVECHANEFIVVFRVPFVDKDILARINYSLSDLLSVKTVSFPPFSQDEIKKCAEEQLKRYNFTITATAWKYFFERISEEKSDGKFYGVKTIKKVVRELVYQKHITNSKKTQKSEQINAGEAKVLCTNTTDLSLSGEEQLNKLVGVDSIKKRVNEIIAQIELAMKDKSIEKPCIHMRFVGNPGTGKTTVARIIGQILKERGVLRVGAFFEYAGRDFCGRYIGETAPKTASICRDAYGSVLFIDEAYSLYRGADDIKDYGREAIDTLIAEMENHRNDFVVIMAGYNDDMATLMNGNNGLASRMPYTIEFPNFNRDQLYDIFVSMLSGKFKYDKELLDVAREFFTNLPDSVITSKQFANARYVRNLFERTWAKAAMRCQLNGQAGVVLTREDFEHASAEKEFTSTIPKRARIGF